jgi:hypothetical protein
MLLRTHFLNITEMPERLVAIWIVWDFNLFYYQGSIKDTVLELNTFLNRTRTQHKLFAELRKLNL